MFNNVKLEIGELLQLMPQCSHWEVGCPGAWTEISQVCFGQVTIMTH